MLNLGTLVLHEQNLFWSDVRNLNTLFHKSPGEEFSSAIKKENHVSYYGEVLVMGKPAILNVSPPDQNQDLRLSPCRFCNVPELYLSPWNRSTSLPLHGWKLRPMSWPIPPSIYDSIQIGAYSHTLCTLRIGAENLQMHP
ncbi:hypothetical protein VNO77_22557 [Canavalia gladiata]|uniref:Uncharacterized protein n=1 Tax=Canavalia gladiata TaxID=3824 RepID=A0AAN9L485_CANGL